MTFREQIKRRATVTINVLVGVWVASAGLVGVRYRPPALQMRILDISALLAVVGLWLLRTRCPRCNAWLPWLSTQIAKKKTISACPHCDMSFDEPMRP